MNTSYDEIWQTFLENCKRDDLDLPNSDTAIYNAIRNALLFFNNRMRTSFKGIDAEESLDNVLSEDELLILANYIRLVFLNNEKTYFEGLWQPFQKDVGLRNFSTQLNSIKDSVEKQEKLIERLFINQSEDFL